METFAAPAVDTMVVPPDQVEHVFVEPGSPEALAVTQREPISSAARVRLVLTMLALLGARRGAARLGARCADDLTNRNRELLYLIVVGLLTAVGFASVYIADKSRISAGVARRMRASSSRSSSPRISSRGTPSRTPIRMCCRSRRCSQPSD